MQYEGLAEELDGGTLARYQAIYFEVWPDGRERLTWAGLTYFVVRPQWIRYSDVGQVPAVIREWWF